MVRKAQIPKRILEKKGAPALGTLGRASRIVREPAPEPAKPALPVLPTPTVAEMVESIVGCKWSIAVLSAIRAGESRPGRMRRAVHGISEKVLAQRLDKLLRFGLTTRAVYPEIPPRVEYALTPLGRKFCTIIDAVTNLQRELE